MVRAVPYTQGAGFGTAVALANGTSSPLGAAYAEALSAAVAQAGCGGISNVLAGECTEKYTRDIFLMLSEHAVGCCTGREVRNPTGLRATLYAFLTCPCPSLPLPLHPSPRPPQLLAPTPRPTVRPRWEAMHVHYNNG